MAPHYLKSKSSLTEKVLGHNINLQNMYFLDISIKKVSKTFHSKFIN